MTSLIEHTPAQTATDCRISFRQPVSRDGSVDAAWWPRSADLTAELPALLNVFRTAGRPMTRVVYNLDSWDPAPRMLRLAGELVHVGGYHYGDPRMMTVTDAWQVDTADLLVIPSDTDPAIAERLLNNATVPGNLDTAKQMNETARS